MRFFRMVAVAKKTYLEGGNFQLLQLFQEGWGTGDLGLSGQGYGFPSGHVWMWELNCEESEHWKLDAFEL